MVFCVLLVASVAGGWTWMRDRGPSTEDIAAGRTLFMHEWQPNDPLSGEGDGLGPVFNGKSCVSCHSQGGVGGSGGIDHSVLTFEVDPSSERTEVVSHVVHSQATSPEYQETTDTVSQLFPIIPGGVRVIGGCSVSLSDHNPVIFQRINSPALFGAGVLDDVSEMTLVMHNTRRFGERVSDEFRGDFNHNGHGFARSHFGGKIGKFGWKGQHATLEDFVAAACAMELGLSNPQKRQPLPLLHDEDKDAELDMTREQLDQLVSFVRSLPAPKQILPDEPLARERAMEGQHLFHQARCTDCHVEDLGEAKMVYTDFQLYSLERRELRGGAYGVREDLEFDRPLNVPRPDDWKTPPLWGVADSAPYFHDGSAVTLSDAINRHFGDARHSLRLYKAFSKDERAMVVEFLETLKAPQMNQG